MAIYADEEPAMRFPELSIGRAIWRGSIWTTDQKAHPRPEHQEEGSIARAIEQQTAKLPSKKEDTFLWAAVGSMGLSLALELMGEEKKANFVGHWAPTLLIFGLYNKLVKLQGSDGV